MTRITGGILLILGLTLLGAFTALLTVPRFSPRLVYNDSSFGGAFYNDSSFGGAAVQALDSGVTKAIEQFPGEKREASLKVVDDLKRLPIDGLYDLKFAPCGKAHVLDCRGLPEEEVKTFVEFAIDRLKTIQGVRTTEHTLNVAYGGLCVSFFSLVVAFMMFLLRKKELRLGRKV
jgi:hypothetical protein